MCTAHGVVVVVVKAFISTNVWEFSRHHNIPLIHRLMCVHCAHCARQSALAASKKNTRLLSTVGQVRRLFRRNFRNERKHTHTLESILFVWKYIQFCHDVKSDGIVRTTKFHWIVPIVFRSCFTHLQSFKWNYSCDVCACVLWCKRRSWVVALNPIYFSEVAKCDCVQSHMWIWSGYLLLNDQRPIDMPDRINRKSKW